MRLQRLIVLGAALSVLATGAFAQVVQYIIPEAMPSLPYSYGVSFPDEIKTLDVYVTAKGTKFNGTGITSSVAPAADLKGQMAQALTNLDVALKELRSSKMDVAKLKISFAGDSFDQVEMLSDQLEHYFLVRNSSKELKFPPVRTLVGMKALDDPNKLVEIRATLIDPKTKPEMMQNQGLEVPEDYGTHGKTVLLGGITAMNKSYLVKGLNSMRTQLQTSLKNLELVLAEAGGSRNDVKAINVFFKPKPESDAETPAQAEQLLNDELKKFFGENNAPTVTLQADEVNCSAYLSVLVDAQAAIKGAAPSTKKPAVKSETKKSVL